MSTDFLTKFRDKTRTLRAERVALDGPTICKPGRYRPSQCSVQRPVTPSGRARRGLDRAFLEVPTPAHRY